MSQKKLQNVKAQFITRDGIRSNLELIDYPFPNIYFRPVKPRMKFSFSESILDMLPESADIERRCYSVQEIIYNKKGFPQKVIYREE